MIIYDFIEQRLDQLNEDNYSSGRYMVDGLYDLNFLKFRKNDAMVNDICRELYFEIEDIPF